MFTKDYSEFAQSGLHPSCSIKSYFPICDFYNFIAKIERSADKKWEYFMKKLASYFVLYLVFASGGSYGESL